MVTVKKKDRAEGLRAIQELHDMGVDISADEVEADEDGGFSVTEAREMLEKIERVIEHLDVDDPAIRGQWSRIQGNYTMVGDVTSALPPGYYDLTADQAGKIWFVPMFPRTDMLLRFPHARVDTVIQEVERFWEREEVFREYGLPYKRGILMYGPPGSGKTCALQLVSRDVVQRGGIVLVFSPSLFLGAYRQLRRAQPEVPVVVLMEDLDAILENRSESNVLQILDGAENIRKTIFVATTNYPERLGARIINRPSRFDKRIKVGHPDEVGRRMYLQHLTDGHKTKIDLERYVKDTKGLSLAHVKELLVATVLIGTPYDEALGHLREMHLEKPTSLNDNEEFEPSKLAGYA